MLRKWNVRWRLAFVLRFLFDFRVRVVRESARSTHQHIQFHIYIKIPSSRATSYGWWKYNRTIIIIFILLTKFHQIFFSRCIQSHERYWINNFRCKFFLINNNTNKFVIRNGKKIKQNSRKFWIWFVCCWGQLIICFQNTFFCCGKLANVLREWNQHIKSLYPIQLQGSQNQELLKHTTPRKR